jgi:SAM-dependent methyltransferase
LVANGHVGCGTGSLAIAAKRHVGEMGVVRGVDASPEMLARAEGKARKADVNVTFQQALAQALPFADAQFDIVVTHCHASSLVPPPRAERKGVFRGFHRHGHMKLEDIITVLENAGLNVIESGAMEFRNLQFALATAPSLAS